MRSTQQFSITLTNEMAELVRAKVESGEYASESEVIRSGLRALQSHERALDNWLREQVAPAYDAMKANPSRAVSAEPREPATVEKRTKTGVLRLGSVRTLAMVYFESESSYTWKTPCAAAPRACTTRSGIRS